MYGTQLEKWIMEETVNQHGLLPAPSVAPKHYV